MNGDHVFLMGFINTMLPADIYRLHMGYVWLSDLMSSLVAQTVKNLPAMQETWVQPLGREDPVEKGIETLSSIPAWKISMERATWPATVHGVTKSWTWLSG